MRPGRPFDHNLEEEDIGQAVVLDELQHLHGNPRVQTGCATWACPWNHTGDTFAWLIGHELVTIVFWEKSLRAIRRSSALSANYNNRPANCTINAGDTVCSAVFGRLLCYVGGTSSVFWLKKGYTADAGVELIALGLAQGTISLWEVHSGLLLLTLNSHTDAVKDLKFAPFDDPRLASASRDGTVKLWDMRDSGNMYKTFRPGTDPVYSVAWSPDGSKLAAVGCRRKVFIWNSRSYEELYNLSGHYHDVTTIKFSPDGTIFVTSSLDTRAIVWDTDTGKKITHLGHLYPEPGSIYAGGANGSYVISASFTSDGMFLATVCEDGYVRFWNLDHPSVPQLVGRAPQPLTCEFCPGRNVLAVGTKSGKVMFFEAPNTFVTLQHLCRMVIRKTVSSKHISGLPVAGSIKSYLRYLPHTITC